MANQPKKARRKDVRSALMDQFIDSLMNKYYQSVVVLDGKKVENEFQKTIDQIILEAQKLTDFVCPDIYKELDKESKSEEMRRGFKKKYVDMMLLTQYSPYVRIDGQAWHNPNTKPLEVIIKEVDEVVNNIIQKESKLVTA